VILAGLGSLIAGFVVQGTRGRTLVLAGIVLGALGGLEVSIREHFAGYRSHTTLLSGAVAVAVLVGLAITVPSLRLPIAIAIALAAGLLTAWLLTKAFQRRSGRAFKIR
jgi:FtsH-binding integral membrane protein